MVVREKNLMFTDRLNLVILGLEGESEVIIIVAVFSGLGKKNKIIFTVLLDRLRRWMLLDPVLHGLDEGHASQMPQAQLQTSPWLLNEIVESNVDHFYLRRRWEEEDDQQIQRQATRDRGFN